MANYILYNRITQRERQRQLRDQRLPTAARPTSSATSSSRGRHPATARSSTTPPKARPTPTRTSTSSTTPSSTTAAAGTLRPQLMPPSTPCSQNNIFQGTGTVLSRPGTQTTNWATSNAYLADPANYDYHLTASSTGAINHGTTPGTGINGFNMNPDVPVRPPVQLPGPHAHRHDRYRGVRVLILGVRASASTTASAHGMQSAGSPVACRRARYWRSGQNTALKKGEIR